MVTRHDAIRKLRAAGRADEASKIADWKNARGSAGGWDAWLSRTDPDCAAFVGLVPSVPHKAPRVSRPPRPRLLTRGSRFVARDPFLRCGVALAPLPDRIVHADWSADAKGGKRQVVFGRRAECGFEIDAPASCGGGERLLEQLVAYAKDGESVVAGFDFAMGVPVAYARVARAAGMSAYGFIELLADPPAGMLDPHDALEQLSWRRPFFPGSNAGWTRLATLAESGRRHAMIAARILGGGGVPGALLRVADRMHDGRPTDASPVFLLGHPKQVGKASLSGWNEILIPALQQHREHVRIWPFDGSLADCVAPGRVTIVETYPGDSYAHLGIVGNNKRDHGFRVAAASRALAIASERGITSTTALARAASDGFGDDGRGEDRFDATIGALAIALVALGHDEEGRALDDEVTRWEGWILGRPAE